MAWFKQIPWDEISTNFKVTETTNFGDRFVKFIFSRELQKVL